MAEKQNVLIVDDKVENLLALEALLEGENINVVKASSGQEALWKILENDFALILLDVQMPDMDGFETAELIRQREKTQHIPIIYITAISKEQHYVFKGYESGAVDYLFKPIDPSILKSKVKVFIELSEQRRLIEKQSKELRKSELRKEAILQSAFDSIITMDDKGRILEVNKAAEQVFGYSQKILKGKPVIKVVAPPAANIKNHEEMENYLLTDGGAVILGHPFETFGIHAGGVKFPIEVSVNRTALQDTEIFTLFARDITERKQAQERLGKTMVELERSNKELQEFAYVVSHDLQEPLRMVSSYTQLLAKRYTGKLDASADEFIAFAVDGVVRMKQLINDLLQYSRVGTRGKEFNATDCEVVLEKTLANLQVAIEESGAKVDHDRLPHIIADGSQLGQLFQNLIGNAIKFRGDKAPKINISAEEKPSEWLFKVSDNGIGISEEYLDRIFVVFQRLHTRQEYAGTGIGLAVCKRIVERHKGSIWVESEVGKGTSFYFTIPKELSTKE